MKREFEKLVAYQKAFELSMKIFVLSKSFPKEETYSLTDQIRRSSRSVCANLAEAYRKRIYEKHFISKLTDCDMENSETYVWLRYSLACNYIDKLTFDQLNKVNIEIGRLINFMIMNPDKYCQKVRKNFRTR